MDFKKPEEYKVLAEGNFKRGCNCAQAVLCAFSDRVGMDFDTLMRLGSSFGGGMGRLRQVCGAVSSMLMIQGLLDGYTLTEGDKKEHYVKVRALAEEFRIINGSINCAELLSMHGKPAETGGDPEPRTAEYYKSRSCADYCGTAARLLADYLDKTDK